MKPASQRSRHLAPGDKLGKYDLIRQIAIGGMAELYLARTVGIEGFEKLVVVKRILPQHASNQSFVDMFLNEARLAATLQHPNVAQVYDIGMDEGDYFFAMEYVHGEDLDHLSTQANEQGVPISMDAALTLVAHLCAGLHYAHEKVGADGKPLEIVHRDISPSNVLVSYDGAVKLVDFGIARATKKQTTTRGGLKGKIAYMSPEQCRSVGALDRRSDLFSVGMILYELTTGQLPFVGETEYQLLDQIVNQDVPPPSTFVPGYPPALEQIVLRALARDRDRRYTSAIEIQGHLEDFAHESRLRVSPLVLARLMSSLYPARLEEWAHAKAQGVFFVEEHVVRTLIEDGKTPQPNDPALRAATDAISAHEAIVATGQHADSERTAVDGEESTALDRPVARAPSQQRPMTPPIAPPQVTRAPTPNPHSVQQPTTPYRKTPPPYEAPQPAAQPQARPTPQPRPQQPAPQPPNARITPPPHGAHPPQAGQQPQARPTPQPHAAQQPYSQQQPQARPTPQPYARPTPQPHAAQPPGAPMPAQMRTPPPGAMQAPIPGVPGAVPIVPMNAGTIVSSSTSNQPPAMATPPPRSAPMSTVALPLPPPSAQTPHGVPLAPPPGAQVGSPVPVAVSYAQADVTERVRVPRRASSDTSHVRVPRKTSPIVWIAGLLVVAGGITAVIALHGGHSPAVDTAASTAHMSTTPALETPTAPPPATEAPATPPPAVESAHEAATAPPEPPAPVETKPVEATKAAADDTKPVEAENPATDETKPVETKPVETTKPARSASKAIAAAKPVSDDKPETPKRPRAVAKPAAKIVKKAVKPDKKPADAKPEPKEPKSWNADSPFMPVRTDKH